MKYRSDLGLALKNINLTIRPSEKIGIVGRTGAGKSTLVKSLFRLMHGNNSGSILIDGHDIAAIGVGDLRPRLGIIPQESTMFSGTFAENLDPLMEFTKKDMWLALKKCSMADIVQPSLNKVDGADDDISCDMVNSDASDGQIQALQDWEERWQISGWLMRFVRLALNKRPQLVVKPGFIKTHPLDKMASDGDIGLSGGQRQLFSLCRMLMRKCKILVLDEATANVDLETDGSMQELIKKEFNECIVLTIAHRLETVMNSDRIIVMERGEIAEIGAPQDLLKNGGLFADLVRTNDFGQ
ncbi:ABC transporter C member 13 [Kickxella alabastrina]|nr:ABC transporter C member 13 [Kickxella alabastrina]